MTGLARRRRAYASARVAPLALSFLAAVALSLPAAANAGDATLRATLAQWSHRIAARYARKGSALLLAAKTLLG